MGKSEFQVGMAKFYFEQGANNCWRQVPLRMGTEIKQCQLLGGAGQPGRRAFQESA